MKWYNTYSKVKINPLSWIQVFLNFSIKSWSNIKIRDSFEIYMFSAFQNCPWFWNLTKIWLRYWGKPGLNWVDWFWLYCTWNHYLIQQPDYVLQTDKLHMTIICHNQSNQYYHTITPTGIQMDILHVTDRQTD